MLPSVGDVVLDGPVQGRCSLLVAEEGGVAMSLAGECRRG